MRIGAEGAYRIGLNEVAIGMPVPILAMEIARDRLTPQALTHATLLARITGRRGRQVGYLDATAAPDVVLEVAKEEAKRLAGLARPAFEATKTRLRGKTIAHIRATLSEDMTLLLPKG